MKVWIDTALMLGSIAGMVVAFMLIYGIIAHLLGLEVRYKTPEEEDDGLGPRLN